MKPHWIHESGILLLTFATLFHFTFLVPTEAEESLSPRKRSDEHTIADLETGEARSPFTIALSQPRYESHPSERSWRFIQGPRFVPPSPGFNAQPSFHAKPTADQYPSLDFRLNPYANNREQPSHAQSSQRSRSNHPLNPYVREYSPSHRDHEFNKPHDPRLSQRPQVNEFQTYREPATGLRAPQEHPPMRHYNVGHQLPEHQDHPNNRAVIGNRGSKHYGSHNQDENVDTHHNQSQRQHQMYDDYDSDDYWHNEEQIPPTTENKSKNLPSSELPNENPQDHKPKNLPSSELPNENPQDHKPKNLPSSELPGSSNENPQDHHNDNKNESHPIPSKNLASLLATTGLRNPEEPKEDEEQVNPNLKENNSKTRTTIPEHLKPTKPGAGDQYYDELYDEFVDMYYDEETTTQQPNDDGDTDGEEERIDKNEKSKSKSESLTETSTPFLSAVSKDIVHSPISTTTRTTTRLTTVGTTKASETNGPPISLSEIIQELGMSLPQLLGTLKTHGTSLKEFTNKLQTKSLSKAEFRRAKGNVKKLLEILESRPDRITRKPNDSVLSEFNSKSSTTTHSSEVSKDDLSSISTTPSTTEKVNQAPKFSRPLVFGSKTSGILFSKPKSKSDEPAEFDTESTSNETNTDDVTKPPLTIDLGISQIVQEKGISSADILQDFNKMFNFSDTKISTISPEVNKPTTVSLRPYKSGAERNRPYYQTEFERGNRNIHRGIINSRLSSTIRPTLRPPYIPKPPSINYGETDDGVNVEFISKTQDDLQESKPQDSGSNDLSSKKKNKYEEFNYSIVKTSPENMDVSTRSAIMAAGILGGVALSVFIAIFIVVKYRNHMHRNRRRIPLTLPSDSSSSSLPPIYASRNVFGKEAYETSGFWTTLKKRFDPYSTSSSPTSM